MASRVSIFNNLGEVIYSSDFNHPGTMDIQGADFAAGIYYLKAETDGSTAYSKFVKQ